MKNEKANELLDVESLVKTNDVLNAVNVLETEREQELKKYVDFFKKNLVNVVDFLNPDFRALEIVNDEGLTVTDYLKGINKNNFKICDMELVKTLLQNPIQLKKVNLIHAVMPFDDALELVNTLSSVPVVSNAETKIILGAYGDMNDEDAYEQNRRVLSGLLRKLDFNDYKSAVIDGTSVKMVLSTYQKNIKMRH